MTSKKPSKKEEERQLEQQHFLEEQQKEEERRLKEERLKELAKKSNYLFTKVLLCLIMAFLMRISSFYRILPPQDFRKAIYTNSQPRQCSSSKSRNSKKTK